MVPTSLDLISSHRSGTYIFHFIYSNPYTMAATEIQKRTFEGENGSGFKRKRVEPPSLTNPVKNGLSQCFQTVTTSLYVSLAPCHIENPINGIKAQHLDPLVMTFFPQAQGVVLLYSRIRLRKGSTQNGRTLARLADSLPFIFMWIAVDLLVWKPQVGDVVEGWAYLQTASHIGLLIHDTFNALVKRMNIPQDWQFVPGAADEAEATGDELIGHFKSFGHWVDGNGARIEGKLQFTIKAIHLAGRVVSVEGSLVAPGLESDAKPVEPALKSSHKKFEDDEDTKEKEEEEVGNEIDIPTYSKSEDEEDEDIVNHSSEEEEESD